MKPSSFYVEKRPKLRNSNILLDLQQIIENYGKGSYPILLFPKSFTDKVFDEKKKKEIINTTTIIDGGKRIYKPKQPIPPLMPYPPNKPYLPDNNIPRYYNIQRNSFLGKLCSKAGFGVFCWALLFFSVLFWGDYVDYGFLYIWIFGVGVFGFFLIPILISHKVGGYFREEMRCEYTEHERKKMSAEQEQRHNKKKSEYLNAEKKYYEEIDKYKRNMKKYENDLAIYQKQLREWTVAFNQYEDDTFEKHINECLKSHKSNKYQSTNNTAREGSSENLLFIALEKIYPQYIKIDTILTFYYPDLVLWVNGIGIDIEIDEPYTFEDGITKEIHYILEYNGESIDKRRNDFFVADDWFVLRFSESQIKNNLQECLTIIRALVDFITSSLSYKHCLDIFNNLSSQIETSAWTKERARAMARTNQRML